MRNHIFRNVLIVGALIGNIFAADQTEHSQLNSAKSTYGATTRQSEDTVVSLYDIEQMVRNSHGYNAPSDNGLLDCAECTLAVTENACLSSPCMAVSLIAPILAGFSNQSAEIALASSIYNTLSTVGFICCGEGEAGCSMTGLITGSMGIAATTCSWLYWTQVTQLAEVNPQLQIANVVLTAIPTSIFLLRGILKGCNFC